MAGGQQGRAERGDSRQALSRELRIPSKLKWQLQEPAWPDADIQGLAGNRERWATVGLWNQEIWFNYYHLQACDLG